MNQSIQNNFLKILLFPLTVLFGLISDLRNFFFNKGILKISTYDIPIVSVGNIVAGGTGKTPFIMLLIELLQIDFSHIVVISRGYGRKSKGLQIVSDGKGNIINPVLGGDEPVMIARKYPNIPVIVSEKRSMGIEKAVNRFESDMVLLDDAFQHRWIRRDCDIVLISGERKTDNERLLPAGNLRERLKNLNRANLVVVTSGKKKSIEDISHSLSGYYRGPVFNCEFKPDCLVDINLANWGNLSKINKKKIYAFAAIANPERFRKMLIRNGVDLTGLKIFPDHHSYSNADIDKINSESQAAESEYVVTTEKDLVKLNTLKSIKIPLLGLSIKGVLEDKDIFTKKLYQFIDMKM